MKSGGDVRDIPSDSSTSRLMRFPRTSCIRMSRGTRQESCYRDRQCPLGVTTAGGVSATLVRRASVAHATIIVEIVSDGFRSS